MKRALFALLCALGLSIPFPVQADQMLVSELNSLCRRATAQVLPVLKSPATTPQEKRALWTELRSTIDSFAPRIPASDSEEAIAAANRIAFLYEFIESSALLIDGAKQRPS